MPDILLRPWPWYVAGPLIGLFAPLLLWLGNRLFGVSSNLRHLCAAIAPRVRVHRLTWPHRWTDLEEAIDLIEHEVFPDHGGAGEPASNRGAAADS